MPRNYRGALGEFAEGICSRGESRASKGARGGQTGVPGLHPHYTERMAAPGRFD
jgi:hypothetical protein